MFSRFSTQNHHFIHQKVAIYLKHPSDALNNFVPGEVPGSLWDDWNTAWQVLDSEKLGYITRAALKQSRHLALGGLDGCLQMCFLLVEQKDVFLGGS